jgi:hypothetical protein
MDLDPWVIFDQWVDTDKLEKVWISTHQEHYRYESNKQNLGVNLRA